MLLNIYIQVRADVVDVAGGTRHTTNTFHYTFLSAIPHSNESDASHITQVVPTTYADGVRYLEGRRRVLSATSTQVSSFIPPDAEFLRILDFNQTTK